MYACVHRPVYPGSVVAGPTGRCDVAEARNRSTGAGGRSQYTNFRFTTYLLDAGIDASVGSVGDALDNALLESTIGLYKTELVKPARAVACPGAGRVGQRRVGRQVQHHPTALAIGHVPPNEYESTFYARHQPREVVGVNC
jgi:putative transposase